MTDGRRIGNKRRGHCSATGLVVLSFLFAFLLEAPRLHAQTSELPLFIRGTYTTAVKVYPNPASPSPSIRSEYTEVTSVFGAGAEVQVPVSEEFAVSIAADLLTHVDEGTHAIVLGGALRNAPIRDGFTLIPVELGIVARVPLGTESAHLTMGGGLGMAFGIPIREVAGVGTVDDGSTAGVGMHVNVGFDHEIVRGIGAHLALRFRDPEVTLASRYAASTVTLNGVTYVLPSTTLRTKIAADGFNAGFGLRIDIARIFGPRDGS